MNASPQNNTTDSASFLSSVIQTPTRIFRSLFGSLSSGPLPATTQESKESSDPLKNPNQPKRAPSISTDENCKENQARVVVGSVPFVKESFTECIAKGNAVLKSLPAIPVFDFGSVSTLSTLSTTTPTKNRHRTPLSTKQTPKIDWDGIHAKHFETMKPITDIPLVSSNLSKLDNLNITSTRAKHQTPVKASLKSDVTSKTPVQKDPPAKASVRPSTSIKLLASLEQTSTRTKAAISQPKAKSAKPTIPAPAPATSTKQARPTIHQKTPTKPQTPVKPSKETRATMQVISKPVPTTPSTKSRQKVKPPVPTRAETAKQPLSSKAMKPNPAKIAQASSNQRLGKYGSSVQERRTSGMDARRASQV